ncbi:MAG TPA: aminotransferase class V-fold PLP-dependent enzyme [Myxococcota bacterium]|nr:aminotransferase class V-fold PLP-dependent enzyme [Myxococcota bacterium]
MLTRRQLFAALTATPALLALRFPVAFATSDGEGFWQELRRHFLIPPDQGFFNTGTLGAMPASVLGALTDSLVDVEVHLADWAYPSEGQRPPLAGYDPEDAVRAKLGELLGCEGSDLALTRNATMGHNFVALGLELSEGDEILITDQEHPGGRSGWDLRASRDGILVTEVGVDPRGSAADVLAAFEAAMSERTRVLAVPHVSSKLGLRLPVRRLSALARERGIFSVIDGAQAPGQLAVDLSEIGCDAYFSSPHKWLLAPKGSGLLFIRPEAQDQVWSTIASAQWDNHDDGLFRLQQIGTGNRSMIHAYEACIDWWLQLGLQRGADRAQHMARLLRAGLADLDVELQSAEHPDLQCAITTIAVPDRDHRELQEALWKEARVRVRAVGDALRISTHIYTLPGDIERLVTTLAALLRAG